MCDHEQTYFFFFPSDTEMFCSKISKQSQFLKIHLGSPENGFGLAASPECCECEARNDDWISKTVCCGNFLFCTVHNNIPMKHHLPGVMSQTKHSAFQHHMSNCRQGNGEWSPQHTSVSWAWFPSVCSTGCPIGFTTPPVPQTVWHFPVLSSLLRITLTLACPMDLKNFPMDVQTCIMQLESCESSVHLHFGEEIDFPFPSSLTPPSSAATHSQLAFTGDLLKNNLLRIFHSFSTHNIS